MSATQSKKKKTARRRFTAAEKCKAVLTLWTERMSGADLCRELDVTWNLLTMWQEQAMDGMLQALEPKWIVPVGPPTLSSRLRCMLERKTARPSPDQDPEPSPTAAGKPPQSKPPQIQRKPPQDRPKAEVPKEKSAESKAEEIR